MTTMLHQIQKDVGERAQQTVANIPDWPCRKGCDDCCRSLASVPRVTRAEWDLIAAALDSLPAAVAIDAWQRIRDSASASRLIVCPLLDTDTRACLVYDARPVACRAYGFYAQRQFVLGCNRIEAIGHERPDVVWGNHETLEDRLGELGPAAALSHWLSMLERE